MKHPVLRSTLKTAGVLALAALASTTARAEEESPFVSGTLALSVNTHFISYGADVWGAGTKWEDGLINPSVEFGFALSENVTAILGTWWDVNKNAASNIGNNYVQEVDVWAGVSVASGSLTYTLLYQEWMYASQSERIVDFKVALDHPLSPSFTVHGRVDGEDMDTGAAFVAAIAPGTEAGALSLSFPVNVAADTDGFHGGDAGFSYASAGVSASLPLEVKGSPSLTAGLTFFYTNDDVIPNNPDEAFVTGSVGISIGF
jgi:hypothetical protein